MFSNTSSSLSAGLFPHIIKIIMVEIQRNSKLLKIFLVAASLALITTWLIYTPSGLLGKADAVGYAVCHRISARSFFLEDRPIPLCARCSGMYLGAFLTLLFQIRRGKRGGYPSRKVSIILFLFLAGFAVDGSNSYVSIIPGISQLYPSQNWLRLVTGTGMGIGMAALLYPLFNQIAWSDYEDLPALQSWQDILILLGIAATADLLTLTQNPFVLYPLAIISSGTVLAMLAVIYTIIWILILKRENQFKQIKEIWWLLLMGLDTAILQIFLFDFVRLTITGTWNGFIL